MKIVKVDVVILGDGITGCSAAYWLQKRGHRVLVLSKTMMGRATVASGGMLTPSAEVEDAGSVLIDFALENCKFYPEFVRMIEYESSRKLSFSLQLSNENDYEGGELQFLTDENISYYAPKKRGTLVIFDSRSRHRVTKVRSGVRRSLVGWVNGPRWQ